ncbi:multidrug effflux MFS transporter [Luminiphilus sp.]|nr:multidrug effflux MFS transporter [Luminiphilus sp.]MDA9580564.1 multidrug effflux MFS transporter [Luminiphilus sp.]
MKERITFATLVALVAYAAIATDLYLPAIPAMVAEFGGSTADGQLTLSTFMLGIAVGQLIFGPLSDYYGRLPVVKLGTVLFLTTSIACALASSMEFMWVARLAQGLAAASGPVIARAIVRDRYEGPKAAQIMAILSGAMAVVPLMAPTLGAWLLILVSWRATYLALAIFAAVVLLGLRSFEESAPHIRQGKIGILPVLLHFSTCLRNRRFVGYQICGTAAFSAILAYLSTVSFFMQDVFSLPTQYFGYAFAITVAGFMVGALLCARIVIHLGINRTLAMGTTLSLLGALGQSLGASFAEPPVTLLAGCSFVMFLGVGFTSANATMGALSLFPDHAGSASAVFGFTQSSVAALVGICAGHFYEGSLTSVTTIMLICAAIGMLGLPLARAQIPVRGSSWIRLRSR